MISFDVFDTLITRTTWEPYGIFLLMQKRLAGRSYDGIVSDYVRENFAFLRGNAETYARQAAEYAGKEEVVFSDIYTVLAQKACISDGALDALKNLEIEAELEQSVPVLANIKRLKTYLNQGEQIVLISDMYLPKEVIKKLLFKADPMLADLPLYLSCETGRTKRNGSLYVYVKEERGVCYSDWTHYGDNSRADIKIPEMLGIKAVPVRLAEKIEGHKALDDETFHGDLEKQIFLGTARNVSENYNLKGIEIIGAEAGGFLLYPYVFWVVQTSIKRGYNRLYFISRDGFLLKKIADRIIAVYHYEITTYYLYGSRKAWRVRDESSQRLLHKYLLQELAPFDEAFALVDLQGTGKSMAFAAQQIRKSTNMILPVFYYQMFSSVPVNGCNFMQFCTLREIKFLEPFARAPHGAVLGYQEKNGRIVPSLAESDAAFWKEYGLLDYIRGVEIFAWELSKVLKRTGLSGASVNIVQWISEYLRESPDKKILDFIGDMPHNDTIDDKSSSFAPRLSKKDVYKLYLWRTTEEIQELYPGNDLLFSLKRMSGKDRLIKQLFERQRYRFPGKSLHRLKYLVRKKKTIFNYRRIVIYGAGEAGRKLFYYITYETRSRVTGWTDIDYQELRKRGVPVVSLEKVLVCQYDGLVIAIQNSLVCAIVKELLVSRGADSRKIMGMNEFKAFLEKADFEAG